MDAYDAAKKTYELTCDALKLAEMAKPYKDGEQWAVNAVIFLRLETARMLKSVAEPWGEAWERYNQLVAAHEAQGFNGRNPFEPDPRDFYGL